MLHVALLTALLLFVSSDMSEPLLIVPYLYTCQWQVSRCWLCHTCTGGKWTIVVGCAIPVQWQVSRCWLCTDGKWAAVVDCALPVQVAPVKVMPTQFSASHNWICKLSLRCGINFNSRLALSFQVIRLSLCVCVLMCICRWLVHSLTLLLPISSLYLHSNRIW